MENHELVTCLLLLKSIGLSWSPHITDMRYLTIANIEDDKSIHIESYKNANTYLEGDVKYSNSAHSYLELIDCLRDLILV